MGSEGKEKSTKVHTTWVFIVVRAHAGNQCENKISLGHSDNRVSSVRKNYFMRFKS